MFDKQCASFSRTIIPIIGNVKDSVDLSQSQKSSQNEAMTFDIPAAPLEGEGYPRPQVSNVEVRSYSPLRTGLLRLINTLDIRSLSCGYVAPPRMLR